MRLKGIIAAGGHGTRLLPITKVTNKHLLPVYNKPMIYYPLESLLTMGIKDILIVSGPEHAGHFLGLLGSGREFGVKLSYEVQEEAGGIAQVLALAEDFADSDRVALVLGDNIFSDNSVFAKAAKDFLKQSAGAKLFIKAVSDPQRFGVVEIKGDKIVGIEEKPAKPKSNLVQTGMYMYDNVVFEIVRQLKPSNRGELEITDVNINYLQQGNLSYQMVEGDWTDAGTFESLLRASNLVAKRLNSHKA